MVSAKCTFQLSRSSTLASAAAIPPSAITVCALPRSDLKTSPTRTPVAEASIAARKPAPPAPITRTSYSKVSYAGMAGVLKKLWGYKEELSNFPNPFNEPRFAHEPQRFPSLRRQNFYTRGDV